MIKKSDVGKAKTPKIRVEFEMKPEDVKKLLAYGKKKSMEISDEELKKLGEEGVIKASDYLDNTQVSFAAYSIPAWISEVGNEISDEVSELSDQIHNPEVQETAAYSIEVALIAAKKRGKESAEKRPKQ